VVIKIQYPPGTSAGEEVRKKVRAALGEEMLRRGFMGIKKKGPNLLQVC